MRKVIAAILVVSAALFAASMLGVAVAEAPTAAPVRTVSVTGVGMAPIPQKAGAAEANAAYREAMAAAVADGQGKASFLVSKVSATMSAIQSVSEGGGSINCVGVSVSETPEQSSYAEYEGERPDFPSSSQSSVAPFAERSATAAPRGARKRHKRKRPTAKKAGVAGNCKVTARVSLVYALA